MKIRENDNSINGRLAARNRKRAKPIYLSKIQVQLLRNTRKLLYEKYALDPENETIKKAYQYLSFLCEQIRFNDSKRARQRESKLRWLFNFLF